MSAELSSRKAGNTHDGRYDVVMHFDIHIIIVTQYTQTAMDR